MAALVIVIDRVVMALTITQLALTLLAQKICRLLTAELPNTSFVASGFITSDVLNDVPTSKTL